MLDAGKAVTLPNGEFLLQSATSRYVAWIAIFLVVTLVSRGLLRRRIGGATPAGAILGAFIIPLLILPGIAMERVRVTPTDLEVRTGYWMAPTTMHYALADLVEIEEGRTVREDLQWKFRYANGKVRSLRLPNLLEGNRPPVVEALKARGILVR
jgi:hypothetical protein